MPSDSAYWLIAAPHRRGDDQDLFRSVKALVGDNVVVGGLEIPDLKVSRLSPVSSNGSQGFVRDLLVLSTFVNEFIFNLLEYRNRL